MKALMRGRSMEWEVYGGPLRPASLPPRLSTGIRALSKETSINSLSNAVGALASLVYAFVVTYILAFTIDRVIGLRVSEEEEYVGLDLSQHGERV